jgi:hypothetical protein
MTGVRSLAEQRIFPLASVQTSSEAHPSSYTMGTGGPSSGVKCSRGMMPTIHPHLVLR